MLRVRSRYPESGGKLDSTSPSPRRRKKRETTKCFHLRQAPGKVAFWNWSWNMKSHVHHSTISHTKKKKTYSCHVIVWPTPPCLPFFGLNQAAGSQLNSGSFWLPNLPSFMPLATLFMDQAQLFDPIQHLSDVLIQLLGPWREAWGRTMGLQ